MSRKHLLVGLVCVAVLAIAVAAYVMLTGTPSGNAAAIPQTNERFGVAVAPDDRTMGSPKAPLVILEYAAPSCPHCARFPRLLLRIRIKTTGKADRHFCASSCSSPAAIHRGCFACEYTSRHPFHLPSNTLYQTPAPADNHCCPVRHLHEWCQGCPDRDGLGSRPARKSF